MSERQILGACSGMKQLIQITGLTRWLVFRFTKACFDTLWFGWLWFGWLWFGKLTNQTHQPHECGSVVKPITMALCGGFAAAKRHKRR